MQWKEWTKDSDIGLLVFYVWGRDGWQIDVDDNGAVTVPYYIWTDQSER